MGNLLPMPHFRNNKMKIIEAIILGIVQGITEFLPVSSSGHLVVLQKTHGDRFSWR